MQYLMPNVLIASANKDMSDELEQHLRSFNFAVDKADSAESTMKHLTEHRPAVAFISDEIDCQPGFRVTSWFKNQGGQSPVVIIGEPGPESVANALEGGADDYVSERTDFREILCRIYALLRRFPYK